MDFVLKMFALLGLFTAFVGGATGAINVYRAGSIVCLAGVSSLLLWEGNLALALVLSIIVVLFPVLIYAVHILHLKAAWRGVKEPIPDSLRPSLAGIYRFVWSLGFSGVETKPSREG